MAPPRDERGPLRVLVVDDSAVVREVLTTLLSNEEDMRVETAPDPIIAMDKMKRARPDVVVLDLNMPRMNGLDFLRRIMATDPIPVVICSGVAEEGTEAAFQAIAEGAVEIVRKPKVGLSEFLYESAVTLIDVVRAASQARVGSARGRLPLSVPSSQLRAAPPSRVGVVAVGASTGGPEAVRTVLDVLPPDAPPVLIVQHMPEHFTRAFAARLDATSALTVREASDGDRLERGRALVAPGNKHMRLVRRGGHLVVEVGSGPFVSRHRPSVDVLFRSVAEVAAGDAVGVLLTGMGDDGAEGLLEMRRAGAATVAQDEASCVVFGMPARAIQRGAAEEVVPLDSMADTILRLSARRTRR
jgi:two-component system chemotaxis response regulator CheB